MGKLTENDILFARLADEPKVMSWLDRQLELAHVQLASPELTRDEEHELVLRYRVWRSFRQQFILAKKKRDREVE